eukprot:scaffold83004_cov39-Phaeocystis_antarctica.AAC.1
MSVALLAKALHAEFERLEAAVPADDGDGGPHGSRLRDSPHTRAPDILPTPKARSLFCASRHLPITPLVDARCQLCALRCRKDRSNHGGRGPRSSSRWFLFRGT